MKIDLKRVAYTVRGTWHLGMIKDELWRLIFTPLVEVDWSVISVILDVRRLVQLSLTCVSVFSHLCGVWRWKEWHYSIHVYVLKSWPLFGIWILRQTTQFCRALALQALVECLGINWCWLGLKVPISMNWVRFRPRIWDGATSSTGWGFDTEALLKDVWGLHWWGGQSSVGWTFYQYFYWDLGPTFKCVWLL